MGKQQGCIKEIEEKKIQRPKMDSCTILFAKYYFLPWK